MKKQRTIILVALGCAKNMVDLQVMMGYLHKANYKLVSSCDEKPVDVILVNTCAFLRDARKEAEREIKYALEAKAQGRCKVVVVSGCYTERYGENAKEKFSGVDVWLGIDALDRVVEVIDQVLKPKPKVALPIYTPNGVPCKVFDPPVPAIRLTGKAWAYLKIAEGCLHRCSYCTIPSIRGGYRSRSMESIVAEAKVLLATGVRELNVVAQDPMLYGIDGPDKKPHLVELLKELDKLEGDFWIRVLYAYPSEITDEFLDWMKNSPHAVKYLDVPLQHTDKNVLEAMARGSAIKATLGASERIVEKVGDNVSLRTTVMVGFPGETETAFKKLRSDLKRMKFNYMGVFVFSPEVGTEARKIKEGVVPKEVALERKMLLEEDHLKFWHKNAKNFIGKSFRALVVDEQGTARLEYQAPDVDGVVQLNLEDNEVPPELGTFINVRIIDAQDYVYYAVVQ